MGWVDGFASDAADDEVDGDDAAVVPASETMVEPLLCKHCKSDKLGPRSSDAASVHVQFGCAACGKRSTFAAPFGFRKIYILNQD